MCNRRSVAFVGAPVLSFELPMCAQVDNLVARMREKMGQALRVLKVKGDGRCLFRSIARNLALLSGRNLPERLEKQDADFLREAAYQVRFRAQRLCIKDPHCRSLIDPPFFNALPSLYSTVDGLEPFSNHPSGYHVIRHRETLKRGRNGPL